MGGKGGDEDVGGKGGDEDVGGKVVMRMWVERG